MKTCFSFVFYKFLSIFYLFSEQFRFIFINFFLCFFHSHFIIFSNLLFNIDPNLCSHLYAICFIAQSLFDQGQEMQAKRCTQVCPHLSVFQIANVLNPSVQSDIHDNSISIDTQENIVLGMNISERFVSIQHDFKFK